MFSCILEEFYDSLYSGVKSLPMLSQTGSRSSSLIKKINDSEPQVPSGKLA